jgi:hypothetical protein
MCAGDTTLEKSIVGENDGLVKQDVEGWGVVHECKDYGAIFDFAEGLHATNEFGIN